MYYKILLKIIFQIFTIMHEIWIGIENYQSITIFCVHCNMHSPQTLVGYQTTYTLYPLTNGIIFFQKLSFGIKPRFSNFLNISKNHLYNHLFFFGWSFDVSKIIGTNGFLILIFFQKTKTNDYLILKFLIRMILSKNQIPT